MKTTYKTMAFVILLSGSLLAKAQTGPLDFTLNSESAVVLGQEITLHSTLTKAGPNVTWTQQNNGNTEVNAFVIGSVSENWDANTSLGTITYVMDLQGTECTLLVTGNPSGISATLSFMISEQDQEDYTLNINAITYQ